MWKNWKLPLPRSKSHSPSDGEWVAVGRVRVAGVLPLINHTWSHAAPLKPDSENHFLCTENDVRSNDCRVWSNQNDFCSNENKERFNVLDLVPTGSRFVPTKIIFGRTKLKIVGTKKEIVGTRQAIVPTKMKIVPPLWAIRGTNPVMERAKRASGSRNVALIILIRRRIRTAEALFTRHQNRRR